MSGYKFLSGDKKVREAYKAKNQKNSNESDSDSDSATDSELEDRPFQTETTLYQDEQIRLIVKSAKLTRHVNFNVEDHLFKMSILSNSNRSPLILSITKALSIGMTRLIKKLRRYYPRNQHRQMYIAFTAKDITGGLNSQNCSIWAPINKVVSEVLNMIENYCQSNRDFKLDESCLIQVKILSMRHAMLKESLGHRRKDGSLWKINTEVGCSECLYNFDPHNFSASKWLYLTPIGVADEGLNSSFLNQCLLICLVLGAIRAGQGFRFVSKPLTFDFQKRVKEKPWLLPQIEGMKLFIAIQEVIIRLELKNKGPYNVEKVTEAFCEEFSAQVIIFSHEDPRKIVFMHPPCFDSTRFLVPLLQAEGYHVGGVGHLNLIINLKTFRRLYGFTCFSCFKTLNGPSSYHLCPVAKTCFCCRRPLGKIESLTGDFCDSQAAWDLFQNPSSVSFVNDFTKKNSASFRKKLKKYLAPPERKTCEKCNLKCMTFDCYQNHKCQRGFFCLECQRYIYKQNFTFEETKANHEVFCGSEKCMRCYLHEKEYLSSPHLCTMAPPKVSENFNNIGLIYTTTYLNEEAAALIYEKEDRGRFYAKYESTNISEENLLWVEPFPEFGDFNGEIPKGAFGLNKTDKGGLYERKVTQMKLSKKPLISLLAFILKLFNYVLLLSDDAMTEVLEILIQYGLSFDPFFQGQALKRIFLPVKNLTFLPISSYLQGDIHKLSGQFRTENPYLLPRYILGI